MSRRGLEPTEKQLSGQQARCPQTFGVPFPAGHLPLVAPASCVSQCK